MTIERNRRTIRPKISDTARACRQAHDEIGRFFQWTGSSDSRLANAWRQRVTEMILTGSTVQEAVSTVKDDWYGLCRRDRVKPQAERSEPELAARLSDVIREAQHGATPEVCALMYRHAARDFPSDAPRLVRWAALWESWGAVWQPILGWES